jgi:hypothetical protein
MTQVRDHSLGLFLIEFPDAFLVAKGEDEFLPAGRFTFDSFEESDSKNFSVSSARGQDFRCGSFIEGA